MSNDNSRKQFGSPLIFSEADVAPYSELVILGKDSFLLFEASEDAAIKWRGSQLQGMQVSMDENDKKRVQFGSIAETEPLLVGLCLAKTQKDFPDKPLLNGRGDIIFVGSDFVRKYPKPHIIKAIYARILEISPGLREQGDTEEILQQRLIDTQNAIEQLHNGEDKENLKNS